MVIVILKEKEKIQDTKLVDVLKKREFKTYSRDDHRWIRSRYVNENGISEFVGIVQYENIYYLSVPKSISVREKYESLFERYSKLIDLYFDIMPDGNKYKTDIEGNLIVHGALKFENVFEWMLGYFFKDRLYVPSIKTVMLKGNGFLDLEDDIDITLFKEHVFHFDAVSRNANRTVINMDYMFERQKKVYKNIPDVVSETMHNSKKVCCIMDAKYISMDKNGKYYRLPDKDEIHKQFFYQDQLKSIYDAYHKDVAINNYFFFPDYFDDSLNMVNTIFRFAGVIHFDYHEDYMIGVIQTNIDRLVEYITDPASFDIILNNTKKKKYKKMLDLVYDTVLFNKPMEPFKLQG